MMLRTRRFRWDPLAMMTGRGLLAAIAAVSLLAFGLLGMLAMLSPGVEASATSPQSDDDRPVIDFDHEGPIKVVFQITTPDTRDGVGKGLFHLNQLHASYVAAGADPDQLDIRAVFHGDGAVHLLTDEAWNRVRGESGGNPSTALISDLTKKGVHIELCDSRRITNGWAKSDVHPGVLLVKGAFQRLIDLQGQGYAYIRY